MQAANQENGTTPFDHQTYLKILITIARADRKNTAKEYAFIRKQAARMGVDYEAVLAETDRDFDIGALKVSRHTALRVLKDAIMIASMDSNFTLPEKEKVYRYAEKLDIPRTDVDELTVFVEQVKDLDRRWKALVAGQPHG